MTDIKITKAQRTYFGAFAKEAVKGILAPILEFRGLQGVNDELMEAVLAEVDLSGLTEAIAKGFIERVDYKTITKVDKFMKGEEFLAVHQASAEVNAAVQGLLIEVIAPLIPLTPEEQAQKDAAKAE